VIGELIGELATSHTYVYGGDRRREPETVQTGMLGCDWSPTPRAAAGGSRGSCAPPTGRRGRCRRWRRRVDAREGDLLIAVEDAR